jgi:hypothetical protein
MAVARADRKAELRIARPGRVEVVHGVHDMVETARDDALLTQNLKSISVMAGHSPSKTGVDALMFRPSTPCFAVSSKKERRGWPGQARP